MRFVSLKSSKLPAYVALGLLVVPWISGWGTAKSRVVVYCAQDREFAEDIFDEFTRKTALSVTPKYDIESEKSVGLALEISREKDRPRCDIHWNNEILWTIRLQRQGLLEPYARPFAAAFPAFAKAKGNPGCALPERARRRLWNPDVLP